MDKLLILYDGHCLLCNRFISRLIENDKYDKIRVAPLEVYAEIREDLRHPIDQNIDSVILIHNNKVSYKSDAVLHIKSELSTIPWFYQLLKWIPGFLRNLVYDLVAKYRYRWFGRSETCIMPPSSARMKYLMTAEELESSMT